MKPKHLHFACFIASLVMAAVAYSKGDMLVAFIGVVMAPACAMNASRPEANRRASFMDIIDMFTKQK